MRSIILSALIFGFCGAAAADTIEVRVPASLDTPEAVEAFETAIHNAAERACAKDTRGSMIGYPLFLSCVRQTVAAAAGPQIDAGLAPRLAAIASGAETGL